MRLAQLLVASLPTAWAAWDFINPPPPGATGDYHDNPVYKEGSSLTIAWVPDPQNSAAPVTVALWQLNAIGSGVVGDIEYITRSSVNLASFPWVVTTAKDLSVSTLFLMSIYTRAGDTTPVSNSHYFNITLPAGATSPPPSTTPSSSTTDSAAANSSTPPASASSSSSDGGLSTGAKIGIGVGIPCAVLLGALAGYVLVRRSIMRQQQQQQGNAAAQEEDTYPPPDGAPGQQQQQQQWGLLGQWAGWGTPGDQGGGGGGGGGGQALALAMAMGGDSLEKRIPVTGSPQLPAELGVGPTELPTARVERY